MRTVSASIATAIAKPTYRFRVRATVEPSRIFFSAVTEDHPWSGADDAGLHDSPVPQTVGLAGDGTAVTFINNAGTLIYMVEGSGTPVTTALTVSGGISILANYLYYIASGEIRRKTIDWSLVLARDTNPFIATATICTPSETPLAVHALSGTECAILTNADGGIRAIYWNGYVQAPMTYRFMFPRSVDHTSAKPADEKNISDMALFSGACILDTTKVFIYITNRYDGSVLGVMYDLNTDSFGDIFTAVPTNLIDSFCELRLCNAYTHQGMVYLVGQFHRTENVSSDLVYNFILSSRDGRIFSIDRFVQVSALGYRFHAVTSTTKLVLSDCNRVCRADLTYIFNGTATTNHLLLEIPGTAIREFQDSNGQQASLDLADGCETLAQDSRIQTQARVKVYGGYATSVGYEDQLYGTYILDELPAGREPGRRNFSMALVHESEWRLSGLSSPYYVEFFSRSSLYDGMKEESGNLYPAPEVNLVGSKLIADFWLCEAYSDEANNIVGVAPVFSGGLTNYTTSGAHKHAYRTQDLMTMSLSLDDYPVVTADPVTANLRGWSHDQTPAGTANDLVKMIVWAKNPETKAVTTYTAATGGHFPNTYPASASGDFPLAQSITGIPIGHKITHIGVIWEADHATDFLMGSVELNGGVEVPFGYNDSNTGWKVTPDKGYQLPTGTRPYVMFSQKPYDAWNFRAAAHFDLENFEENPGVAGYSIGFGVVGLASDGANYIVGRLDWRTKKVEIVKIRKGHETQLASADSTITLTSDFDILFEHRDGTFRVYLHNASGVWTLQLSYDWVNTDGWMFLDPTSSKKVGIFGHKNAPWYRITGFDPSSFEPEAESTNADGIACLPGYSLADFPSTGKVRMGKSIYSYNGVVDMPVARGPYQYRQNGTYVDPYGDGMGLESLDFDWSSSAGSMAGKLLALDDGSAYLIDHSLWQIFDSLEGVRRDLTNRSRQYSLNLHIDRMTHSHTSRVYVTGGLLQATQVDGEDEYIAWGDVCAYYIVGDAYCRWFISASGEGDTTITDLVERISSTCGARSEFPGDITYASLVVSGDTPVASIDFAEGLDIRFSSTSQAVSLLSNVHWKAQESDTGLRFDVTGAGTDKVLTMTSTPSNTIVDKVGYTGGTGNHSWRFTFHENFISVVQDDAWVHTFAVEELVYPDTCAFSLTGSFTATDVRVQELSDWREAVYIDLESDGKSGLGSVLQERPLEVGYRSEGQIAYWYAKTRDSIAIPAEPRQHSWSNSVPGDGASDALVYGSKEVKCVQYLPYAQRFGFATRVLRFPNLGVGMVRAAKLQLQRTTERSEMHQIVMRPDIRIEPGDILDIDYTASGSKRVVAVDLVVEQVSLSASPSDNGAMQITGRIAIS